jgi:hypothetical protein
VNDARYPGGYRASASCDNAGSAIVIAVLAGNALAAVLDAPRREF